MTKLISKRGKIPPVAATSGTKFVRKHAEELRHCMSNPSYFIEKYVMIPHGNMGPVHMQLEKHQDDYIKTLATSKNVIAMLPRGGGMTTRSIAFCLWEALFTTNQRVVCLGINVATTKMMCDLIHHMINYLPTFMKPGIKVMRRTEVVFDNGSSIHTAVMTPNVLRGQTINRLYLDCFALAPDHIQKDTWMSIVPCLATGGKVIMASTPHGKSNTFATLWLDAINQPTLLTPFKRTLDDLPVTSAYKQILRNQIGEINYRREYQCEFV